MHTRRGAPAGRPAAGQALAARRAAQAGDRRRRVASVGLLLTAPLFAYIACRIKRDSPGPVFFRQTRLGMNMREFTVLKFRTMHVDTDDSVHREYIRADDEPRVAAAGRTASTSSSATTRSRRSGAGCGRRASTSCRS